MDSFELEVRNYFRTLEACTAEQASVFGDIREAFITFVEEIQLGIRVTAGAFDTIEVQKLLHQDFLELFCYLQPNLQVKEVESFFKHLEESDMNYLDSFRRKVSVLRQIPEVGESQILREKIEETERKDLTVFLFFINNIMHGIMARDSNDVIVKERLQKIKEDCGIFSFKDEVMEVDAINKRNLGKMIIRYVGHEGVDDKHNLRRLLQACIDYLQNEAEGFWKNASITIYDDDDMYKIVSGTKKHQFICRMKNREPIIIEKTASEYKKHKSTHKAPRAQTQGHPSKGHGNNCVIS